MRRTPSPGLVTPVLVFVYAAFFLSLFCGLRVLNSTTLGCLSGLGLVFLVLKTFPGGKPNGLNLFMAGCLLFYLLQLAGLFYTHHPKAGTRQLEVKLTLVLVPLLTWSASYLTPGFRKKLMPWYVLILVLFIFACLGIALSKYRSSHDESVFFYHELVHSFLNHAIQTSILVFVGLVYLLECCRTRTFLLNRAVHFLLIAFLFGTLILLSSKMIILFSFVAGLVYLRLLTRSAVVPRNRMIFFIVTAVVVLLAVIFTENPVSTRFRDLFNGSIAKVEQKEFVPGDYFNGIQFRVLQWKFVSEILTANHAWLAGVSPGDGQAALDAKYISVNMYIGDGRKSRGYLGYNTHNQFLESALQSGLLGLTAFLLVIVGLFGLMIRKNQAELWLTGILLFLYCFQDAVFQTQFGGVLFVFFPLFLYYGSDTVPRYRQKNSVPVV